MHRIAYRCSERSRMFPLPRWMRNGMPHNRIIDVMIVEENRLVFCTARGKDFYRQLTANPHVAISGLNKNWQMIRLTGTVQEAGGPEEMDRPHLRGKSLDERRLSGRFAIYPGSVCNRIRKPRVLRPRDESDSQGELQLSAQQQSPEKGFLSPMAASAAAPARANCPQQCIEEGSRLQSVRTAACTAGSALRTVRFKAIVRRGRNNR
jgi:hypothetical protein